MEPLIAYIAKWRADAPDAVRVEARRRGERITLRLDVAEADMGRVIGKEGRIAMAMRTLLRAAGQRRGRDTALEIR